MLFLQDSAVAALAAVGLTSIIWLTVSMLFRPRLPEEAHAYAVVPAKGKAEHLEQTVRHLLRVKYEERAFSRIVILDCGMEEEARHLAILLCRENCGVETEKKEAFAASLEKDRG